MSETRVKIQSIVENQLPDFIAEENPLLVEFLKQYYISQEYPSGCADLIQNIDKYIKLDEIFDSTESCILSQTVSPTDTTINVSSAVDQDGKILSGTKGFPDRNGLIKIDDEIITYTSKTDTTFEGCTRGFSGVTSYSKLNNPEELVFSTSVAVEHEYKTYETNYPIGPIVHNLSGIFLQEFLKKLKQQFIPGFAERTFDSNLNQNLFIKESKSFYTSKGTDKSFKILFGALYGEPVEVLKPRDFLFRPSDAGWRRTKDLVVEKLSGNPLDLLNNTLYQNEEEDYDISEAYASITDVEKISIGGTEFYKLSFDADYNKDLVLEGTVYGEFSVHPKTLLITPVSIGATTLDVDSTVGFAKSGELAVTYDSGVAGILTYYSKSSTQFFDVTNVTAGIGTAAELRLNVNAYGYSGITTDNPITVRIGSVLDEVVIPSKTYLFSKNDTAKVKTLGISSSTIRRNNWISNVANTYKVDSFELQNQSNWTYEITTYDTHNFRAGDKAQFIRTDDTAKFNDCEIVSVSAHNKFSIRGQGELDDSYTYEVQRYVLKVESSSYPYLGRYNANLENTYTDYDNKVLVASPSLPFYNNQLINPYSRKVTLTGEYSGTEIDIISQDATLRDHGFFTGDKIYYQPYIVSTSFTDSDGNPGVSTSVSKFPELEEGLYFVKRVNSSKISLAKSPSNIQNGDFISLAGIVTSNVIQDYEFARKEIRGQNLLREIEDPLNRSGDYETEPGKTGIFVNGVELLNYKSSETVFYGKIKDIEVGAPGSGYDVINPPSLDISDSIGAGATGICAVNGSLERIEIIDSGFDYVTKPFITIDGGNGKDASAEISMRSVGHEVSFDSTNQGKDGDVFIQAGSATTSLIGFSTYHKFRDYEKIVYDPQKQTALSGFTTDSFYHVNVVDATTIRLHETEDDAIAGINTVYISNYGVGKQLIKSSEKKDIISNILVSNSGEGYQNKKRTVLTSGISTSRNIVNIDAHGYETGETLTYATTGTAVDGLNTSLQYLVKKVNDDSFKLAPVGLGTTSKTEYLDSDQYIDLKSIGSGVHSFNYPAITVSITGSIGVSTLSNQDFNAKIQPIFRGNIDSVHLTDNGSKYGSDHIINYDRQPTFTFRSGKNAEATVIVNNGKIIEVLVTRGGSGYNTPPDLEINGTGNYAKLTPIIESGQLKEIKVINGGIEYDDTTTLTITGAGSDCRLRGNLENWTVNLFKKYLNTITPDDGIIDESDRDNYGLQYCHMYAPRELREEVFTRNSEGGIQYGNPDLKIFGNKEQPSEEHSPIIGWAYDGNPIYGPYGYTTPEGGTVRALKTGYKVITNATRPPETNFPSGFFNEDYAFKDVGDLDEHNGRYCVTPDFPKGVYAYFTTINSNATETDGSFEGFFQPEFPYVIGTSFYSQPNSFNFSIESNQEDYDLNNSPWFRNTLDYRLKGSNSEYDFVFNPNKLREQTVNIDQVSNGSVESVGVVTGGKNYNVNDRVLFDNALTDGSNAAAKVKRVYSPELSSLSVATTSYSNVEFGTIDAVGNIVGFTTAPHGLKDAEIITISGISSYYANLQGSYNIGVRTDNFVTTLGIGSTNVTGLTTYIYTTGFLDYPYIRENDILGIGNTEKVKVLNIDKSGRRIKVLRAIDGTVGFAYSASIILKENPRKFTVNTGFKTDYSYLPNREIYFDPNESVGVGTSAIAGLGSTAVFSMPGLGATQVFVPYQQIYLPNHGLKTGEKVTYSSHGGTEINVLLNGTKFALPQTQDLYVANISQNFVGISTVKVGLGTTGTYVGIGSTTNDGLLFFRNFGTGSYHSFTTKRTIISGEINQNIVTVLTSLGSTHGLSLGDNINFNCIPKNEETITVKYDDDNRRALFNPSTFVAGNVSTSESTITISDHGLRTGDKVIYTASSPAGGLTNESIYYISYYTKDKIRLCATKYDLFLKDPNYINITSATAGTISLINPELNVYKNKIVKFDVSDSSLASIVGVTSYSAFSLNFYRDPDFNYEFDATGKTDDFEVVRTGETGIGASANVKLFLNDFIPNNLYYKLEPVDSDNIADIKKEIIVDKDVYNNNQINLIDSVYSGTHRVVGLGTTTVIYNLTKYPEASSYAPGTANLYYTTKSTTAYGAIESIEVLNGGRNYKLAPGITTVSSSYGKDALLDVSSKSIGIIEKDTINNIGFDYPSDNTLSPSLNLPEILQIKPLNSFKSIGISSGGKNYLTDPSLVVLDGFTGKQVDDVSLVYQIGNPQVKIFQNTYGMYNVLPTIIPIHNSNGVGINTITFNSTTKKVTVGINTGFSELFPFAVGDKVLIENTSVGVGSTSKGYNSEAYNYKLFPVTSVNEALGGNKGQVVFDMTDVLDDGQYPGYYDSTTSGAGRIIPAKDFPIFDIKLQVNDFLQGEEVTAPSGSGVVDSWNNKIETLKVTSDSDFQVKDIVTGKTSFTKGIIESKIEFDSYIKLGPYTQVDKGWKYDTGILNNNVQRLPDNDYYQYFSYSLKSKIPYQTWNDPVSSLNHTSGFLKFSDLIMESTDNALHSTTFGEDSVTDITVDIEGLGNLHCFYTFDLATEETNLIGSTLVSDEIKFQNRILSDYNESIGNRVLTIDDFSGDFNHKARGTKYAVVDNYKLSSARAKKYFTYVRDTRYTDERQIMVVMVLHDNSRGVLNQYGRVETYPDLGSFDWRVSGNEGQLLFYPNKFKVNNYDVTHVAYDLKSSTSGIGSTALGSIVHINSHYKAIANGASSAQTIVGIASTYRSVKVLVEIGADDESYFEYDELNLIHDGSTVNLIDYGGLSDNNQINPVTGTYTGLGTYYPYIDGTRLKIDFTPDSAVGVAHSVNSMTVSIASSTSTATGVGTASELNTGLLDSWYTSIAASGSPGVTTIAEYHEDSHAAYYIVQVEDTTNKQYEMSEVLVVDDGTTNSITEYGNIRSHGSLGSISANIDGSDRKHLTFTPNKNIKVQVKVFQNVLSLVKSTVDTDSIGLDYPDNNAAIESGYATYEGTERDIKRQFGLLHNTKPIFQRFVDGSDSDIVSVSDNTISIPDHYFVTGEKLSYSYAGSGTTQAISVASTSGTGFAATTKVPASIYCVKINESTIKLAASAEKALLQTPVVMDITAVGIGTSHSFTSNNQNSKALVAIDNWIQSPLVGSALSTTLAKAVGRLDTRITFSGITSFFSGNLVQINDEIMKINTVGLGSTNVILVDRPWMGTGLADHSAGSMVKRVDGNYNIRENTIHFVSAPYGPDPIGSTTNAPDDRDWTGIATHSTFQGRTFMRSGKEGTIAETYTNNMIFDDISNQFTGIGKTFTLTKDGANVTGFSTNNGIVLVNGVFQGPEGPQDRDEDYEFEQSSGITSIFFTGTASSATYDPNNANVPVGGVIVSVGSTEGWGLQPLVAAGGTAVVSSAGTIQSVGMGTSGSGYRLDIQPTVNVAIQTSSLYAANYTGIGTAQIVNGGITGIAITNPQVFYKPQILTNIEYSGASGLATITTFLPHKLERGEDVILSGIAMTCEYAPPLSISTAAYTSTTGIMTVTTTSAHGFNATGKSSVVIFTGLGMTCAIDSGVSTHYYPRGQDYAYNNSVSIASTSTSTITVNVGVAAGGDQYAHTFKRASANAIVSGGDYLHSFVSAASSALTSNTGLGYTPSNAQYTGSTGIMTVTVANHGLLAGTNTVSIAQSSIVFRCAMDDNATLHSYPRATDPYYDTAISIASTTVNTLTLQVGISSLKYDDVSAATYNAATGDLVMTVGAGHSLTAGRNIKIAQNSLTFTCARDAHATEHSYPRKPDPGYGGIPIQSVGTTTTFTLNVGISTVPTFYQGGGTVQAAIMAPRAKNFSSSGQDTASGGTPISRIVNEKSFEVNVGVSTREHIYARGGKVEKALKVKFDDPLSYSNIPLIYSSESSSGIGTYATIDVVVGQGSSVIDFEIRQTGYGFGQGEILTVNTGGSAGIPTDPTVTYKEFQIEIEKVYSDSFAGWTLGEMQILDDWDALCDGANKTFSLKYNGDLLVIRSAEGSSIDVKATILIFINDVLQQPGESYTFDGGSVVTFSEAPKKGDETKIIYYKGTGGIDVKFKDILETVKVGDELTLRNDPGLGQGYGLLQDMRVVTGITTGDSVETNPYVGPGITTDQTLARPVKWCKQTRDKIINGVRIGKNRELYEGMILPTSYLIQSVGVGSTCAWVQNAKPFFDPFNEDNSSANTDTIELISQDSQVAAAATVNVSTAGTISSFSISSGGYGYASAPTVSIADQETVGVATTATATATISSGVVTAISVSTPGTGYTSTNPPVVLIGSPAPIRGEATEVTYQGDFGIISGIKTTSVGVASTGIIFDLFIPPDSELRDSNIVGVTTVSGIATGYYFTVNNSTVGNGVTSLYQNNTTLGIGSTYIDNVYEVAAVSIGVTAAESKTGAGLTAVAQVTVSVANLEGLSGLGYSGFYGNFSWGKVLFGNRATPQAYNAYTNDGITGISTGGILRRLYPLAGSGYTS